MERPEEFIALLASEIKLQTIKSILQACTDTFEYDLVPMKNSILETFSKLIFSHRDELFRYLVFLHQETTFDLAILDFIRWLEKHLPHVNYSFWIEDHRLSANKIGNEGAAAIAHNVVLSNLAELLLHGNQIGDQGALALASNVSWKSLRNFRIQSSQITSVGQSALKENPVFGKQGAVKV